MFEVELERPTAFPSPTVRGTAIAGLGVAIPEPVVTNQVVADRLGVTPEWITERTGVKQRHVAPTGYTVVDLATDAGLAALEDAGLDAAEIDLVIVCSCTGEMLCPAAAPVVAANLGCDHAAAFDLNAACSGFLSGLAMASGWIATGGAERVLVVGADLMYRVIDHDDRSTAGIFADGGGAVVLAPCAAEGRIGRINLASDGSRGPLVEATREEAIVRMNGHDTFRQAVKRLCESTELALEQADLPLEEIDLFVYHQANSRIIAAVGEKLGLDPEKVVDCVGEYGNTSAGSIPIALGVAREDGRLRAGSKVMLGAFGGGLTWGAGVVAWGSGEKAEDVPG
jgi:3-oxoacyl-[acyl-carrier-protein] synthase-3